MPLHIAVPTKCRIGSPELDQRFLAVPKSPMIPKNTMLILLGSGTIVRINVGSVPGMGLLGRVANSREATFQPLTPLPPVANKLNPLLAKLPPTISFKTLTPEALNATGGSASAGRVWAPAATGKRSNRGLLPTMSAAPRPPGASHAITARRYGFRSEGTGTQSDTRDLLVTVDRITH